MRQTKLNLSEEDRAAIETIRSKGCISRARSDLAPGIRIP